MKFKNILMALGLGSMLMTSCTLDEEVYTFISGEDLSADGEYELVGKWRLPTVGLDV